MRNLRDPSREDRSHSENYSIRYAFFFAPCRVPLLNGREELDEESFIAARETVRRNDLSERVKVVKVSSEESPLLEAIASDPYVPSS